MTPQLTSRLALGPWQITIVTALAESTTEAQVRFLGGTTAVVANSLPDRQLLMPYLSFSLRLRCPIGVLFGDGDRIVQAGSVLRTEVLDVNRNVQHPHVLNIVFGGEAAPKSLSNHHPRFGEMIRPLSDALATQQPIWCIIQGSSIVEVMILGPHEDEALCRWIQHGAQAG